MKIDMHCHLDLYQNPFEVAKECDDKGIYLLSVTTTPKAWEGTKLLAHGSSRIRTALGLHPNLLIIEHTKLSFSMLYYLKLSISVRLVLMEELTSKSIGTFS
ncbi:TatD family hydrolase [Psychrobacter sp. ER1]|uniref:TatD family hydrolase n=1 Tax=Psychrobacter sp. ER1 TaxID=3406645 RepID=UPI003B429CD4